MSSYNGIFQSQTPASTPDAFELFSFHLGFKTGGAHSYFGLPPLPWFQGHQKAPIHSFLSILDSTLKQDDDSLLDMLFPAQERLAHETLWNQF